MTIVLGIGVVIAIFVAWELAKHGLERSIETLLDRFGRRSPTPGDDDRREIDPPT